MQSEVINIIVTSAGTASAVSVIKSLKKQQELPVKIIAVDADPLAAGLFLADQHYVVPAASSPDYLPTLLKIGKEENATLLIPIYSKEIQYIAEQKEVLEKNGIKTMLSAPEVIRLCNDKKAMYDFAAQCGLKIPRVYSIEELETLGKEALPLFAKPNSGSSSSGAEKIESLVRLKELAALKKDYVFQQFIQAEEVTVDIFCNHNSEALVIAPRLRLSTKSGQSVKGKTISNAPFKEQVKIICKQLQIKGACNMQFFIDKDQLYFIEVNPRFAAGGLMLTVNSGANIPLLLVKEMLGLKIDPVECATKENWIMTRYWEEIIIEQK